MTGKEEWVMEIGDPNLLTKKDDDFLGKLYKVLEFLALNIGRAKDR